MGNWRVNRHARKRSSMVLYVLFVLLMLSVVLLMLLGLGILSLPISSGKDSLSARGRGVSEQVTLDTNLDDRMESEGEGLGKRENQWTEVLSWEPRAFLYHNFLSKEECVHMINLAKPHMTLSTVVDDDTGDRVNSSVRTSTGMFLEIGQDRVIRDIEKRIADYTQIPVEHGEGLQILHYEVGQKYDPHCDYFEDEFNLKNGGQRLATVLMYLSDVEEGGETVFPAAKGNFSSIPNWDKMSECAKEGLFVKPKMGDALLFWSLKPDGSDDPMSMHGACPVIRGNKWSSTKWLHVDLYDNS
ncbi:2-oxoglutarate (2OG) and Fe(II)-dependent oxygenase superfamily protein [Striga asiatica]|uniref:procollagen-proline 4-dioxygenase n=1 Tax=Striga asiatica TaxID=4170 RepID=A0A5A7Q753_STRAF|nr:2-oxoglutarate (2OG) and Fe(II)-dependent oxygenase superfamily protein [Striga asiatica]